MNFTPTALFDAATGEPDERVEERVVVPLLHLERERLDLPDITAAVGPKPRIMLANSSCTGSLKNIVASFKVEIGGARSNRVRHRGQGVG
jgi:hypothetical protein